MVYFMLTLVLKAFDRGEAIMGRIDPIYATTVTVTGGREGHAVSDDGVLDVQLRRPKRNGVSEGT